MLCFYRNIFLNVIPGLTGNLIIKKRFHKKEIPVFTGMAFRRLIDLQLLKKVIINLPFARHTQQLLVSHYYGSFYKQEIPTCVGMTIEDRCRT